MYLSRQNVRTYPNMLGCDSWFISWTSFSMFGRLDRSKFIFRTITWPVVRCVTCNNKSVECSILSTSSTVFESLTYRPPLWPSKILTSTPPAPTQSNLMFYRFWGCQQFQRKSVEILNPLLNRNFQLRPYFSWQISLAASCRLDYHIASAPLLRSSKCATEYRQEVTYNICQSK